ncbi:MAG: GDSL-type esterase/lipase family protein [Oscillospiraceae bacterium]|nr:GDSL-type esterase/lipase family protein [Oscillospiraceae bacterium]
MKHTKIQAIGISVLLAAGLCATGCGESSVSDGVTEIVTTIAETSTTVAATTVAATTTEETTTVEETTTTEEITTTAEITTVETTTTEEVAADPSTPDEFGLTAEDRAFLKDTVFVGDSICSGLRVYKILPDENVLATGSVAARNVFEFTYNVGGNEYSLAYALTVLKPRYVIFSMGMNDINMTTPEQYCTNYDNIVKTVQTVLPDSKFFIASITPIAAESEFSTNERIDLFNQTLKNHLTGTETGYVDVATGLKADWINALEKDNNGGDGIHLASGAYYKYLNQVCDQLVDTKIVGGYGDGIAYGWAKT